MMFLTILAKVEQHVVTEGADSVSTQEGSTPKAFPPHHPLIAVTTQVRI